VAASKLPVASWVLYDLANTIYSMNVVSLYFALWVVRDAGGTDGAYGLANSLSQALIFLTAPLIGTLSDQAPRRVPLLAVTTVICCAATALLGTWGLAASLALFVVANYFFQAGLIFYDALLPSVSTEQNRGRIGGLGVGLGYFGSFIGVAMGLTILAADPTAKPLIFKLTGVLFLLFAIPCFIWVRERPRAASFDFGAVGRAFAELRRAAAHAREYPGLARFLVGRVFYADAASTIIAFMAIYVTEEVGFSEQGAQLVLLLGIAAAVVGGLVGGVAVDRFGPKRTLNGVLALWVVALGAAAAVAYLPLPSGLFWGVAALAGGALGGTWAADRPFLLRLAPPARVGEFVGLYAMVGRFAAILGPLLWALVVDVLRLGRPAAVLSLLLMVVVGYWILRPVSDRPNEGTISTA
jgi:UMF1 family MFS transporter